MAQVQQSAVPFGRPSTQRTGPATVAGLCYLAVIAGGLFAEVMVRGALIVPGDAAATARAILENETLWRLGLAVHLLYLVPALTVNVIVSGFFRSIEPTLARLALVFGVAGVTVEAVALVYLYVPLVFSEHGTTLAALEDAPSLIYLATRLFATGFGFSLLLFAGFCVLIGALILRSRLVPRAIGAMMILAGICYVVNTVALIVSPGFWKLINPTILLPILLAELSLALWLLVKGITVEGR
ncbi:MAG: DUF4386 domain-containing protein [Deltaproteobacteria bacterium]|nr:DUF4386 domain-containing protein [Deltaproteobacteria bacterium]